MLDKFRLKRMSAIATVSLPAMLYSSTYAYSAENTTYLINNGNLLTHTYELNDTLSKETRANSSLQIATTLAILSLDSYCGKKNKPAKVILIDTYTSLNKTVIREMMALSTTPKDVKGLILWKRLISGGMPAFSIRTKKDAGKIEYSTSVIPDRRFTTILNEPRMFNSENKMPFPYVYGYCFDYTNDNDKKDQVVYPVQPQLKGYNLAKWNLVRKEIVTIADSVSQIWFEGNKQLEPSGIFLRVHAKKMNIPNHPEIAYRVRAVMTRGIPIANIVKSYQKNPEKTKSQIVAYSADIFRDGTRVLCPMNNPRDFIAAEFFKENGPTCADRQKALEKKQKK